MAHKFLFNILVCGAISCHCARNGPHNVKCVNPFPSTLFPPLTAVVTADVTNLVLKDYWGPIEYVIMFIVSQQCAWMERHKTTRPITFDLYLCACVRACACACMCWLYRKTRLHGGSSAVYPPSVNPPFKHIWTKCTQTRCSHANTKTKMDVCIPIHTPKQAHSVPEDRQPCIPFQTLSHSGFQLYMVSSRSVYVLLYEYRLVILAILE